MFNISVLIDVQANLPETSPFFVCPNGFGEHLFYVYSTYLGCITLNKNNCQEVVKTKTVDKNNDPDLYKHSNLQQTK